MSETFLVLRRIERDIHVLVDRSSCKVPGILVRLYWNLNFFQQIYVKYPNINVMKISPVGVEFYHTDGHTHVQADCQMDGRTDRQTDLTKVIFAFLNFASAPIFDMQKLHVTISYQFIRAVLCYAPVRLWSCVKIHLQPQCSITIELSSVVISN
jgi:hypothetical protein